MVCFYWCEILCIQETHHYYWEGSQSAFPTWVLIMWSWAPQKNRTYTFIHMRKSRPRDNHIVKSRSLQEYKLRSKHQLWQEDVYLLPYYLSINIRPILLAAKRNIQAWYFRKIQVLIHIIWNPEWLWTNLLGFSISQAALSHWVLSGDLDRYLALADRSCNSCYWGL